MWKPCADHPEDRPEDWVDHGVHRAAGIVAYEVHQGY